IASSTDSIPADGFAATKGSTTLNVKDGDIVTLKKGETLTFASLPAGIKYSIEETNANGAKKTTWKVDNIELADAEKISDRTLADNDAVVVTNTFDQSETGLATRIAPFVAMAVLAGGAVAAYFVVARKRQENE
ncbi:MAG: hypothetical protein IJ547_06015, partial [Clostridia bacterium]|nr:hypothetical protein [Clostridia bacterium]